MWLQDLTKALYYLNSMIGNYLLVESVKDGVIYFTNGTAATVKDLTEAYDLFFKTGEAIPVSALLR